MKRQRTFESFAHGRKRPTHPTPLEIGNRPIIIFLTVCTHDRKPILANKDAVEVILDAWKGADHWLVGRYIILPDHIHLFGAPARIDGVPVQKWTGFWKSRSATHWPQLDERPVWLVNSWDTQLRRGENYDAKWDYVRNNGVRHRLVKHADDWPWQGELNILQWHDK